MDNMQSDDFRKSVENYSQVLLEAMAEISAGNLDANIDIPDNMGALSDLAVGLKFMVEDLRDVSQNKQIDPEEIEQHVALRTRELEAQLKEMQASQSREVREGWEEYIGDIKDTANMAAIDGELRPADDDVWLPAMTRALQLAQPTTLGNGGSEVSLGLPLELQGEMIGILGFNRRNGGEGWDESTLATVEAIVEQVTLALENQRLIDQTQAALAETDLLYKASAELNTAQTYDEILTVIQTYSVLGEGSHNITLGYFDRAWSSTQMPEWVNVLARWTKHPQALEPRFKVQNSPLATNVVQANEAKMLKDIRNDTSLDALTREMLLHEMEARSAIFLPMLVAGRWVGYISAYYENTINYSEEDLRQAMALTAQTAVAVQNLRNIDVAEQRAIEAQERSEELALINRIVSVVASSMDLHQSLETVAMELNRALGVDETGIALLNEDRDQAIVVADAFSSPDGTSTVGTSLPVQGNLAAQQVLETKRSLIIEDVQNNPLTESVREVMVAGGYETMAILPMLAGNEVIGTVGLVMKDPEMRLTDDQMRFAEAVVIQAATSIQNTQLFEQTQSALAETANLYQASAELNMSNSFDDILSILRRFTVLGHNSQFASLYLFNQPWRDADPPSSMLALARWSSGDTTLQDEELVSLSEWTKLNGLFRIDEATVVYDIANDPRMDTATRALFMGQLDANAVTIIPLASAGQWIGVVLATYQDLPSVEESEQRRMMAMAGQAAVAIQNFSLLGETTRKANQLETAAEIARDASSTLDMEILLNNAVNLIRERFGFYHASIFLIEGRQAIVNASTGEAGKQLIESGHSLALEEGKSVVGHVCYTGEPLVINDTTQAETHRPHPLLPDTRAELAIPLKIGERVTGAMDVQSTDVNAFSDEDIIVLRTLADQIAVAVDNARSFQVTQQAVEEMREIDRLKSQFLANMSHELRTPLNSIIGFSRVILKGIDGPVTDLQQQDLEAIHNSGQHLLDMINDILDLSKIDAGKMELNIEEVQVSEVIDSVMSTAGGLVKEKPIRLVNNTPTGLPSVYADRTRIRQVMINLLSNAAKFTDEGTITVDTSISANTNGQAELMISVTDTGIGIAPEDHEKLFEPFSQVDASPTRKSGGSGLGLSISRRLVELQGGRIGLESSPEGGSTFYFTLPMVSTPPLPELDDEESGEVSEGDPTPPSGDSKTILSIDDDYMVIGLYERYLKPHGYEVVALTDSTQAVDQAKSMQPFAITVDVMMPEQDGWQVVQALRKDPDTQNIPIIMCSILDERDRGLSLGANEYLMKPILEDELVSAVKHLQTVGDTGEKNVLVIDDDPKALRLVERTLSTQETYQVSFANGGLDGLAAMQSKAPDAVVLDIFMPDLDGFALLETMRRDPILNSIPVIILTSGDLTEEQEQRIATLGLELLRKDTLTEDIFMTCLKKTFGRYQQVNA
ncbi:MAG: GAF domain-containing protein [Chloroflexi bacterium]|nr:MAG: GAF domain-containing protein [Chloroflexota bacterium]MBL1194092.1 GAF domain-containing protein [Chloroflexota bacterium]NOH11386.1 GAF domain-containing protein [Chloroflexota bacterium]